MVDKDKADKWLVEELGNDPAIISKWGNKVIHSSLEILLMIEKLLNIEVNDLLRM